MAEYTVSMVKNLSGITSDSPVIQDECKRQISILDTAKIPYQRATVNLDKNLHEQITSVNDTLYAVVEEYDKRIDVQGCRSDLFWRVVGIGENNIIPSYQYILRCERLSKYYE